jgi:ABC-type nickel/cobalt efflux system permease component RcnA
MVLCLGIAPAAAHPLGNTTVNVYERIALEADSIHIRYVLDVSEIPAVREQQFADTNDDGTVDERESHTYLEGFWVYMEPKLTLIVDGEARPLTRDNQVLTFPPGQGGLTLMRAVYDLSAPYPEIAAGEVVDASFLETTFDGVPGWHEIIVQGGPGSSLVESSVPAEDLTDELTSYPEDMLNDPLGIREAIFRFSLDAGSVAPSPRTSASPPASGSSGGATSPLPSLAPRPPVDQPPDPPGSGRPEDPLVALVGPEVTPAAMLLGVMVALGLGALHAVSPGHGKTLIAAYLIGTRANVRQGLWLGVTVAVTHTAGVFLLGVATYFATEWVIPDRIVSWLAVATGGLITVLGTMLLWRAWRIWRSRSSADPHEHGISGSHSHGAAGGHSHSGDGRGADRKRRQRKDPACSQPTPKAALVPDALVPALQKRDVAALGIVGGLIPSGSALLLLLSSVALGQVALGVVLILAFGLGMALVLAGISVGVVLMRRSPIMGWERWTDPRLRRIAAALPLLSGAIVSVFGLLLTVEALRALR